MRLGSTLCVCVCVCVCVYKIISIYHSAYILVTRGFFKCTSATEVYMPKSDQDSCLAEWLEWESACIANVRPWVQTPVSPKGKKKERKRDSYFLISWNFLFCFAWWHNFLYPGTETFIPFSNLVSLTFRTLANCLQMMKEQMFYFYICSKFHLLLYKFKIFIFSKVSQNTTRVD
jgi:hypothetical protein